MTRLLLFILLFTAGVKLMAESGAVFYKNGMAKFALQDEDTKQEKGEQENKKYDNEDKFYSYHIQLYLPFGAIAILPSALQHHRLCSGFTNRPCKPPQLI